MKFEEAARAAGWKDASPISSHANRDEIDRRFPKIMRRVSGYNLDEFVRNGKFNLGKLVVGSEGTLAAVHQAKVRIEPRPPATALCVVHFADIVESIRASDIILPFNPSAIELIDDMIINLGRNLRWRLSRDGFRPGRSRGPSACGVLRRKRSGTPIQARCAWKPR